MVKNYLKNIGLLSFVLLLLTILTYLGCGLKLKGALIGLVLNGLLLLLIGLNSEFFISKIYRASSREIGPGLNRTLELAISDLRKEEERPKLLVYPNPFPQIWIVRSFFRRNGTLLLSQGLLASLDEDELRATLRWSTQRLLLNSTAFRSFWVVVLHFLLMLVPEAWVELCFSPNRQKPRQEGHLSPINTIRFWIFFPLIHYLIKVILIGNLGDKKAITDPFFQSAVYKISSAIKVWGSCQNLSNRLSSLAKFELHSS